LQPGDYIHFNGRSSKFSEGAWGILRVLDKDVPDRQKVPAGYSGRNEIPKPLPICPADAPVKTFNVVAIDYPSMKLNPKAPDAIEVDFERKIQLRNPTPRSLFWKRRSPKWRAGCNPCRLRCELTSGIASRSS
jgi:hypothetical protein